MTDLDLVYSPTAIDVLCGTGRQERQHSGNVLFNRIVLQFAEDYNQANSKSEKMKISKNIGDLLSRSGVRFLKKCPIYQNWYVGGPRVGRDKIGHFLRLQRGGTGGSTERLHDAIAGMASNLPATQQQQRENTRTISIPGSPMFPSAFAVAPSVEAAAATTDSTPSAVVSAISRQFPPDEQLSYRSYPAAVAEGNSFYLPPGKPLNEDNDSTGKVQQTVPASRGIGSLDGSGCLPMCRCKARQDLSAVAIAWRMTVLSLSRLPPTKVNEREEGKQPAAPGSNKIGSYYNTNMEKIA